MRRETVKGEHESMSFEFTKMHGAGNDYVYVDCFNTHLDDPASVAVQISDRHFGIGSDGLVLVMPPETADADVRMRIFNADGSEAEMCGNAIRCVAKFAHRRGMAVVNPVRIQTGDGVKMVEKVIDKSGEVTSVVVAMGEPRLEPESIPVNISTGDASGMVIGMPIEGNLEMDLSGEWVAKAGLEKNFSCVSMGNPHLVFFCDSVEEIPLAGVGPGLENDPAFPRKTNVHFVEVLSGEKLKIRTWERGSGITQACGTGASAACVAASLAGKAGRNVLVQLPGGDLSIEWRSENNVVYMSGGAVEVFSGRWGD